MRLTELDLGSGIDLAAFHQCVEQGRDRLGLRRTAGHADVHLHEVLRRSRQLQQRRQSVARHALIGVRALYVDSLQQLAHRNSVAHAGHVAGYGAVAQRNQGLGALANDLDLVGIVLAADRALHQRHVHVFGKFLRVHQRPVHDVHLAQDGNDGGIEVEH
jgi:hypothetical protein